MKNIIITLGTVLTLSAELMAGETTIVEVAQLEGTHCRALAARSDAMEVVTAIDQFDDTNRQSSSLEDELKLFFKGGTFQNSDIQNTLKGLFTAKLTLDIAPTDAIKTNIFSFSLPEPLLQPLLKFNVDELLPQPFSFGCTAFELATVTLITVPTRSNPTVTVKKRRVSRYDEATIKEIQKRKATEKQKDLDRKKARKAKHDARNLWD